MQYLLSHEEMNAFLKDQELLRKAPNPDILKNVCLHVATTMITTIDVNGYGANATEPHGCIHSKTVRAWYCDKCPIESICPMEKDFSK